MEASAYNHSAERYVLPNGMATSQADEDQLWFSIYNPGKKNYFFLSGD